MGKIACRTFVRENIPFPFSNESPPLILTFFLFDDVFMTARMSSVLSPILLLAGVTNLFLTADLGYAEWSRTKKRRKVLPILWEWNLIRERIEMTLSFMETICLMTLMCYWWPSRIRWRDNRRFELLLYVRVRTYAQDRSVGQTRMLRISVRVSVEI